MMLTITRHAPHFLNFVAPLAEGGTCFWAPERSGEREADMQLGRAYAREFLGWLEAYQNPLVYGSIMRAMTAGGIYADVEVGFCQGIGVELLGLGG